MKREDDEQLWDLLGHKAGPDISPFFARNVLRRIREQPSASVRVRSWLSWRRLVPLSGIAVAVIGTFLLLHSQSLRQKPDTELDAIAKIASGARAATQTTDENGSRRGSSSVWSAFGSKRA